MKRETERDLARSILDEHLEDLVHKSRVPDSESRHEDGSTENHHFSYDLNNDTTHTAGVPSSVGVRNEEALQADNCSNYAENASVPTPQFVHNLEGKCVTNFE